MMQSFLKEISTQQQRQVLTPSRLALGNDNYGHTISYDPIDGVVISGEDINPGSTGDYLVIPTEITIDNKTIKIIFENSLQQNEEYKMTPYTQNDKGTKENRLYYTPSSECFYYQKDYEYYLYPENTHVTKETLFPKPAKLEEIEDVIDPEMLVYKRGGYDKLSAWEKELFNATKEENGTEVDLEELKKIISVLPENNVKQGIIGNREGADYIRVQNVIYALNFSKDVDTEYPPK